MGESSVKANESGSLHTEATPLGGDKQLMVSRWGLDNESRILGCRRMDSGRQRCQDKEEVSWYLESGMSRMESAGGGPGMVKVTGGIGMK